MIQIEENWGIYHDVILKKIFKTVYCAKCVTDVV